MPFGNPVLSYQDRTNLGDWSLRVLHCNDPLCSGNDESITTPAIGDITGLFTSLVLDGAGNTIVTYIGPDNHLSVLRCDDANCAPGGDTIVWPLGLQGYGPHGLVLDSVGNPVVGFWLPLGEDLALFDCATPTCAKPPPTPAPVGGFGQEASSAEGRGESLSIPFLVALVTIVGLAIGGGIVSIRRGAR